MAGYVYLIRVGDLYRIGKTDNLDKKIRKLKPDELLTSIITKEPETLEARLLRKYKSQRIPETGYLKLLSFSEMIPKISSSLLLGI